MRFKFILFIFVVSIFSAYAEDRYWVGGTGNWSTTNTTNWSTESGGAGGASVPTSADNVFFDIESNHSGSDANYTVTLSSGTVNCLNLSFALSGGTGIPSLEGAQVLNIYGDLTLVAGMTFAPTSSPALRGSSGTKNITLNGVTIAYTLTINGAATFHFEDNLTISGTANSGISCSAGTVDFTSHSTTVTLIGTTPIITPTCGLTFYNLTRTPTTPSKTDSLTLAGNIAVTHTLTISNGATVTNRVLVQSSIKSTQQTITMSDNATYAITNTDFKDIHMQPSGDDPDPWDASAISGLSGDAGGNAGITFTTGVPQFWHVGTGSWSTTANWFTATNGGGSAGRVPLPQDDVNIDASSCDASCTITQDMPRAGKSISLSWY